MSKHHDLKQMAKMNIKILSNNKIKLRKGQKISIKPLVDESVKGTIISRLEGVIDDNTERFDQSHVIKSEATVLSPLKISDIISHTYNNIVPTIVKVVTKKNALDFNFAGDNLIGSILRSSTLGPIYENVKSGWKNLNNNDKTQFTNIMFIPNILVFSDGIETLFSPYKINLLLIAVPTAKIYKENVSDEKLDSFYKDYIGRVFADIMDCATKIKGCSDIIVNPFDLKATNNYQHDVIDMWNYLIDSPRCKKSINSIWFSIENEFNYVLFIAEKGIKKIVTISSTEEELPFDDEDSSDDMDTDVKVDKDLDEIKDEILTDIKENTEKKKKVIKKKLEEQLDMLDE